MGEIVFSVFAPVYNERHNIRRLYDEVSEVMALFGMPWELVFVDDGSTDGSKEEIRKLKGVTLVSLKKNYGQSVAMDAGFKTCRGDIIISIDADLQNNPKDIPKLVSKLLKKRLDVVAGWRKKRKDPVWMRLATRCASGLRRLFISDIVHDAGCTLRVYRRSAVESIELWGEMHRYLIPLLSWNGAKIGEQIVHHRPRLHGSTKYNWSKIFRGFVDMLYIWFWKKFSSRPLHLFGIGGLAIIFIGMLSGFFTLYQFVFHSADLSDSGWFLLTFFLLGAGMMIFMMGIMFDIIIKVYYNSSKEQRYVVDRIERL